MSALGYTFYTLLLRKRFDGHDILIAVNIALAMPSPKFVIVEGLGETVQSVEVMFEQREISVVSGSFIDSFEAMDVHVYRWRVT